MRIYKFSELLKYEEKIKTLYQKLGLGFSSSSRISKYFSYLNGIEQTRCLGKIRLSQLIEEDKVKYYYSQFYVSEICSIVDAIEGSNQNETIIKEKLGKLSKGTYLLSEENRKDTKARDTEFELSLFSFLYERGLDVELCHPHPDIRLATKNFTYHIECKRPGSMKSLRKHIKRAVKQLGKAGTREGIPTVALSLEQILLGGGDLILNTKNEKSALSFLGNALDKFAQDNTPMVRNVCAERSCLVLYYLTCFTGFKANLPMAHATFMVGNVYNLSKKIYDDLQVMKPL